MVWTAIAGTPPQYSTSANVLASNYYLKFYAGGTTTAINMATDNTGGTTLDKSQLDASGYPTTDGTTRFIPHVNEDYKIVLYQNSTDADNNTTGNADWVIDNIKQTQTSGSDAWILFSGTPTQTSATTFTVAGDQTTTFTAGTRLKLTDSSTLYGIITASVYTSLTTITVTLDTGSLSGSLSAVYTSITTTAGREVTTASITHLTQATGSIIYGLDSMLLEYPRSVKLFGADSTGIASSSTAFQNAFDSLPAVGGTVFAPAGTYLLSTASGVSMPSNSTLKGEGDRTYFVLDGGLAIKGDTVNNVTLKDFKIRSENYFIYFKLCNHVKVEDVTGVGLVTATGALSQYHVLVEGCDEVDVIRPTLDNYNYGYLFAEETGSSTRCGYVRVNGGVIEHTDATHGTDTNNPTGINGWRVKSMIVKGTTFKNIKPSGGAPSAFYGFGVYEGDGDDGDCDFVSVKGCTFIDDDGYTTTRPMCGTLTSVANESVIHDNEYYGNFLAIQTGTRVMTIKDNLFKGAWVYTSKTTGLTDYKKHSITGNTWEDVTEAYPFISMNDSGEQLEQLHFTGNDQKNCKFGVWIRNTVYAHIVGNTLIDLNTNGITDDSAGGGFNFSGCNRGFVDGNTIMNVDTGKMEYGVIAATTTPNHEIVVTENNNIKGMLVSSMKNTYATTPGIGTWDVGNRVKYWDAPAASTPGSVCTTAGTQGTLNSGNTQGTISSGSALLTVDTVAGLEPRQKITIAGVTGIKTVVSISGLVVTLDSNADAPASGAAVAFSPAVFKAEAALDA